MSLSKGYKMSKLLKIALLSIMFVYVNASANEIIRSHKYEHDIKGNVIAENIKDSKGKLLNKYEYKCCKYDSNGKAIEKSGVFESYIDGYKKYDLKIEYKYDAKGKLIEENLYLYDARGNVVEQNQTTYKYDSKGNKIEESYSYSNGVYGDYIYDSSGEVIEESHWVPVFGSSSNEYEYEYKEEESGLFFQVYEKKVIGSHRGSWENTKLHFEYDRTGALTSKAEYDLNGNVLWTEEYDTNGNLIEKVIYKEY